MATHVTADDAIDVLRLRYAQGEITREEFHVMIADLERTGAF